MAKRKRIINRNDVAANWTAVNPILLKGEIAVESDTGKVKVGDGATAWNSLAYLSSSGGAGAWGSITGTLSSQTDLQNALNTKADTTAVGLKLYIQPTTPSFTPGEKALWIDTSGGNIQLILQDGV